MAFGFPATYSDTMELSGARQEARDAIRSIFDLLGWPYSEITPDRFVARTSFSALSWGEKVTVSLESPGIAQVESRCVYGIFDWGENKKNVDIFIERLSLRELRYAKAATEPEYFDSQGKTPLGRALIDEQRPDGPKSPQDQ